MEPTEYEKRQIQIIEGFRRARLVAVLAIERAEDTPYLASALWEGGVRAIELVLRTEAALAALEILLRDYREQFLIGAGTVLYAKQLETVAAMNAHYAVAPGFQPDLVARAQQLGLVFFPGVMTPSDIEGSLKFSLKLLKFFPAEAAGGLGYLQSINAPYAHLGLQYMPLGGIGPSSLAEYLRSPLVAGVGGSWLAPKALVEQKNWGQITRNAKEATQIIADNPSL